MPETETEDKKNVPMVDIDTSGPEVSMSTIGSFFCSSGIVCSFYVLILMKYIFGVFDGC